MAQHIDQARHNYQVFLSLDKHKSPDWAITLMYYTTLHLVHELGKLNKVSIPPHHESMLNTIDPNGENALGLRPYIFERIESLCDECHVVRYKAVLKKGDFDSCLESMRKTRKEQAEGFDAIVRYFMHNRGIDVTQ